MQVQSCYELSAEYEGKHDPQKLAELGNVLTSLDPGDSIVIAKSFAHMLSLANLAEEVQIAYRRRNKLKKGDFADENSATTESDIEETLKRLVGEFKKSPEEVFDALKNQTVDLVFTAHPTQSVRRSLLQKHGRFALNLLLSCIAVLISTDILMFFFQFHYKFELPPTRFVAQILIAFLSCVHMSRIRNCLTQLYAKDITPDDKQEIDEALQREVMLAPILVMYSICTINL